MLTQLLVESLRFTEERARVGDGEVDKRVLAQTRVDVKVGREFDNLRMPCPGPCFEDTDGDGTCRCEAEVVTQPLTLSGTEEVRSSEVGDVTLQSLGLCAVEVFDKWDVVRRQLEHEIVCVRCAHVVKPSGVFVPQCFDVITFGLKEG